MSSFALKLYFLKATYQIERRDNYPQIVAALSEQNISQVSYFEISLFRIKQLTMLFVAHEVLY